MNCYDRHYLKIALPAALEGLFMILLASTDLILVGALGSLSVAAVSIFLQPRLILLCFSRSLASAVTLFYSGCAFAYFLVHFSRNFFPVANGGDASILFCFLFLYLAAAGPGAFSLNKK